MRLIPGPAFTFEAFKEILGAKDVISTLSCSSSADSEVWEHLRPSAHTAVLRAKHLHPGGFSTAAERVGSGSPQGCGQTRVPPQPKGRSSSCCLSYAGQGGSHSQELGTAQPHSLFLSWRPTSALIPSATQKRLVYRKLLCYWLDFVSSSLIYSLRQMPAFPCSALRYQSPTQQLTETPTCLSSKPEKSKCGKPVSHSIYQRCITTHKVVLRQKRSHQLHSLECDMSMHTSLVTSTVCVTSQRKDHENNPLEYLQAIIAPVLQRASAFSTSWWSLIAAKTCRKGN